MPVIYNSKKIIPAPFVVINKDYTKTGGGDNLGTLYKLTLSGVLLYNKGSPDKSGNFWSSGGYPPDDTFSSIEEQQHTSVLKKEYAIRKLFADEGLLLEFTTWETTGNYSLMRCYPRVISMNFSNGDTNSSGWHTILNYTIELEADKIYGLAEVEESYPQMLSSADENWSLEFVEQPEGINQPYTFKFSHNINAVGKKHYDNGVLTKPAYLQAKEWVSSRLGLDTTFAFDSGNIRLDGYNAYNHLRTENTDELGGAYSVTETWILASGNVMEDFTVSVRQSKDSSISTVNIEGTITGLDTKTSDMVVTESRWDSALDKYDTIRTTDIHNRAQTYSGLSLNNIPVNSSVGKNPNTGIITYQYEYDNSPSNCIEGARFENIRFNYVNPHDVFVTNTIPGRLSGPLVEGLKTITESKVTMDIDVVMELASGCPTNWATYLEQKPTSAVAELIDSFEEHLRSENDIVFIENDSEDWEPKIGKYQRSVTWLYQDCN